MAGDFTLVSKKLQDNIRSAINRSKAKFSPSRNRETNSARILSKVQQPARVFGGGFMSDQKSHESKSGNSSISQDVHVGAYDCHNAVSLSFVMSGNVPTPYKMNGNNAASQYNMQGGQVCQDDKYISGDLHDHHHSKNSSRGSKGMRQNANGLIFPIAGYQTCNRTYLEILNAGMLSRIRGPIRSKSNIFFIYPTISGNTNYDVLTNFLRSNKNAEHFQNKLVITSSHFVKFHTTSKFWENHDQPLNQNSINEEVKLTQRQKLKRAVKDYGATVIVFHVAISLASLGIFYLLVSSGIDMTSLVKIGINLSNLDGTSNIKELADSASITSHTADETAPSQTNKVEAISASVGTFVVAYAIHKVFAPVRIAITLFSTPLIVRHLRKIGFLRTPK